MKTLLGIILTTTLTLSCGSENSSHSDLTTSIRQFDANLISLPVSLSAVRVESNGISFWSVADVAYQLPCYAKIENFSSHVATGDEKFRVYVTALASTEVK